MIAEKSPLEYRNSISKDSFYSAGLKSTIWSWGFLSL